MDVLLDFRKFPIQPYITHFTVGEICIDIGAYQTLGTEITKKNNSKIGETLEREIHQLEGQIADLEGETKEVNLGTKVSILRVLLHIT